MAVSSESSSRSQPWTRFLRHRRSLLAIAAGLLLTALLLQLAVDPIEAGARRVLERGGNRLDASDWLYVAAITLFQFAPVIAGSAMAGILAPAARAEHSLVTLNLAIGLWVVSSA